MTKTDHKKRKNRWAMAFFLATAALLLFGVAAQVLCEAMGYDHGFLKYLLLLLPAACAFFLLYHAVAGLRYADGFSRVLLILLLAAVLLWSALMGAALAGRYLQEEQFIVYKFYAWTYPKDEVGYMLQKSRMFGQGDTYFQYADEILEGYDPHQEDLPLDVSFAFDERDVAEAVFGGFRKTRTLPVLSYTYGLWVNWLFALIAAVWCIAAGIAGIQLYRWWERLTYLLCFSLVALQVLLPLLGAFAVVHDWISIPFSANWFLNTTSIAPQLGIMFALVKTSRPAPPMMMVPGDEFWREILDEETEENGNF